MVLKFKPKLDLKFKLKGSKTIKILKGSKNRRRLKFLFAYRYTRNIDVLRQQGKPRSKILSLAMLNDLNIVLT